MFDDRLNQQYELYDSQNDGGQANIFFFSIIIANCVWFGLSVYIRLLIAILLHAHSFESNILSSGMSHNCDFYSQQYAFHMRMVSGNWKLISV